MSEAGQSTGRDSGGRGDAAVGSPGDTDVYTPGEQSRGGPSGSTAGGTAGDRTKTHAAGGSKAGASLETLVGRLVVEQGLATPEEVRHCVELARSEGDPSEKSLTRLLIQNAYVTERQLTRMKQILEAEKSGKEIPGYKIMGKLGAGAMATVYKAKQVTLDRAVAIKVLPRKFSKNPQFIQRFFDEGRAAAQLNHNNIVQAFEISHVGELYYFVMEYVDGRTVHDDIVSNRRYNEADAIDVALQVAEALLHAHERDLIHRDVKPKNIMITKQGVVKLADMGLARAISDKEAAEAEAGKAFGTPYYISPEQIRGEVNIGPMADIYSLGATLYHMVTGTVPFEGKDPTSVMHKHLKAELRAPDHVNPKLSAGISEVIEMMMAKHPKDRYQNCKDLLMDLRALKEGRTPPLAHKEVFGDGFGGEGFGTVETLVAAEQGTEVEYAVDQSQMKGDGIFDVLKIPFVTVLALVAVGSVVLNLVLLTR